MKTKFIMHLVFLFCLLESLAFSQEKEPLWIFPVGAAIQSSPAIGADGTIYFGADNGIFYALTPQGKKKWEFVTSGLIVSSPAIASDGTIYITSLDKIVYAINPDGSEKWRIMPGSGIVSSPGIAPDGTVIVGAVFNKLFSISPEGFRKWEFPTMGNIISSPAIDLEGTIYFGCMDTNFYAVSTNGAAVWVFTAGDRINSSPAIDRDGTIYFGSLDRSVYALAPNGKLRWSFKTDGPVRSSPVIGNDGEIYIGSDDRKIYVINRDGQKKWDFETKDWVRSTPAIAADGAIYVGSYDGNLYALNKDGSLRWILKTQGIVSSSPVIDTNGVLYFGSWDKNFYAVKIGESLASTPWPCFRKNARRAGCEVDDVPSLSQPKSITAIEPELKIPPKKVEPDEKTPVETVTVRSQSKLQPTEEKIKIAVEKNVEKTAAIPVSASTSEKPIESSKRISLTPTIKITSPKNGARMEEAKIVVEGTAKDKNGIKSVQFRFNSVINGTAKGLGKWSVPLILQEGKNVFEARCENLDGNFSGWEQITIYYKPSYKVFTEVLGRGRVIPEISGKKFESGAKIKLKAEPGKEYTFLTWHGSLSDISPEIEFEVRSNMLIKAIFVPAEKQISQVSRQSERKAEKFTSEPVKSTKTQGISGVYRALLYSEASDDINVSGMLTITINNDLTWKGSFTTSDNHVPCEGKFDKDNYSFVSIKRESQMPIAIALKLIETNNTFLLTGKITGPGKTVILSGYPQRSIDSLRNVRAGLYTSILAIPLKDSAPAGDGYAKITVDENGSVQINGKLWDGRGFSTVTGVDANSTIPVFAKIHNGYMAGILLITNTPANDIAGTMNVIKTAENTSEKFQKMTLRVLGSHYSPQVGSKLISDTNIVVAFNGGGLETLSPNMIYISPNNKIEIKYSEVGLNFSLDFDTGFYKGSFMHPVLKKPAIFEGVFLQKAKWGSGYFKCEDKTGIVLVITDSEDIK